MRRRGQSGETHLHFSMDRYGQAPPVPHMPAARLQNRPSEELVRVVRGQFCAVGKTHDCPGLRRCPPSFESSPQTPGFESGCPVTRTVGEYGDSAANSEVSAKMRYSKSVWTWEAPHTRPAAQKSNPAVWLIYRLWAQ